ncbi:8769_t:CDS:1, partial [Funneliformis caledonium]
IEIQKKNGQILYQLLNNQNNTSIGSSGNNFDDSSFSDSSSSGSSSSGDFSGNGSSSSNSSGSSSFSNDFKSDNTIKMH